MGEGWGYVEAHDDYIYEKLSANGIDLEDVNLDLLVDVISRFDYDLLSEDMRTIKADNPFVYDKSYLNKDENGNPVDTHALDYMVNQYMIKSGKAE